jgi:hypothetical protein
MLRPVDSPFPRRTSVDGNSGIPVRCGFLWLPAATLFFARCDFSVPVMRIRPRWVKKLIQYCNTPWNMDGVPITLGEFVEYRDPQPQTRTGVA